MKPLHYVPELDGIRALSVWIVMLFHAGAPLMEGGWVGVDVFFILSGFLITTLMVNEEQKCGSVNVGKFWVRRILRLMPAYFLYLAPLTVFYLTSVSWNHTHGGWSAFTYLMSLWGYFSNFAPQGGLWEFQFLSRHLWSLAVEQQFYLVFCISYVFARYLKINFGVCLLGLLVVGNFLSHFGMLPGAQKLTLFGRGSSLVIGCLVAYYIPIISAQQPKGRLAVVHRMSIVLSVVLVFATLTRSAFFGFDEFGAMTVFSFLLYLTIAVSISGFWYQWSAFTSSLLRYPILVWAGKISYGIYLYHMAVWGLTFLAFGAHLEPSSSTIANYGLKLLVYFSVTHAMAFLSYRYVEQPFLKLKRNFSMTGRKVSTS